MSITVPDTSPPSVSGSLPEMRRPLFWDSDFDQIVWGDHRDHVVRRVLYALTYFADAEGDPLPRMLQDAAWEQAKADIRAWVKGIAAGHG